MPLATTNIGYKCRLIISNLIIAMAVLTANMKLSSKHNAIKYAAVPHRAIVK